MQNLKGLGYTNNVFCGDAEGLHHYVTGGGEAELVSSDHLSVNADVLVPQASHTGFNGDSLSAA